MLATPSLIGIFSVCQRSKYPSTHPNERASSPCTDLPSCPGFSFSLTNFFAPSISHALQSPSFPPPRPRPDPTLRGLFLLLVLGVRDKTQIHVVVLERTEL